MKSFSIFHAPYMSFYSSDFYRDVYLRWTGTGFGYLLLLLLSCWTPVMLSFHYRLSDFIDTTMPGIVAQVPVIQITDGKASTPEAHLYNIKDPATGELIGIVDTTGGTSSLTEANVKVLVTETNLLILEQNGLIQEDDAKSRAYSFADIKDLTVTRDVMNSWLEVIRKVTIPVIYPFCIIGIYLYRILQVLLYAAVGLYFAFTMKAKGNYAAYIRVAVMAVTPCVILSAVLNVLQISFAFRGQVFLVMALGYIFFATKSVCGQSAEEPPAS